MTRYEHPREAQDDPGVSLRLSLMDAQVVDADHLPVGRIDDLELELGDDGVRISAVLVGQRYLGPRLGGATGRFLTWWARRLADSGEDGRIDAGEVLSWSGMCRLRGRLADLPVAGLERWFSTRVVRHIPGADDEGI